MDALSLLIGLAVGAALVWAATASRAKAESERRVNAEARALELEDRATRAEKDLAVVQERLEQERRRLAEERAFFEEAEAKLTAAFQGAAATAMKGSGEQLLALAEQRLGTARAEADADLAKRQTAIETLLAPLQERLAALTARAEEMERTRASAYADIKSHVGQLMTATASAERQTTTLASALRGSQARGRWGELALRNVVEFAGMTEHCDFVEQEATESGKRPDMVVNLPGGRKIPVDAKAPFAAFVRACEATTEAARDAALDEHVAALRTHVRALAKREYAAATDGDVDTVVLFVPGESFLAAALSRDPELFNEALRLRVLIASPVTLVALLSTIGIYHQQAALARDARQIAEVARLLYDRARTFRDHLQGVGRGLHGAVDAFNAAVASYEARLLPLQTQLEGLHVPAPGTESAEAPAAVGDAVKVVRSLPSAPAGGE